MFAGIKAINQSINPLPCLFGHSLRLVVADTLSRSPFSHEMEDEEEVGEIEAYVDLIQQSRTIKSDRLHSIRAETEKDTDLKRVTKYIPEGWPHATSSSYPQWFQESKKLTFCI